jgi:hypothetical protein
MRTITTYSKRAPFYNAITSLEKRADCFFDLGGQYSSLEANEKIQGVILNKTPQPSVPHIFLFPPPPFPVVP